MRTRTTLALAACFALFDPLPAQFTDAPGLYKELLRNRGTPVMTPTQRFDLVNTRFEPAWDRKQELLIREMTYAPPGWLVRIFDRNGQLRMRGSCGDMDCQLANGDFVYFDEHGTMRAHGWYVNGLKSGTWQRWDDRGRPLTDKQYAGIGWEDMQVELGLASRTALWMEMAGKMRSGERGGC